MKEQIMQIFSYKLKLNSQFISSQLQIMINIQFNYEQEGHQKKLSQFKFIIGHNIENNLRKKFIINHKNDNYHIKIQFLTKIFTSSFQITQNQAYKTAKQKLLSTHQFLISQLNHTQYPNSFKHHKKNKIQIVSYQNLKQLQNKIKCLDSKLSFLFLNQLYLYTKQYFIHPITKYQTQYIHTKSSYIKKTTILPQNQQSKIQNHQFYKSKLTYKLHLIVLVHGLKGNSLDLRKIKQSLEIHVSQKKIFFFSRSNQMKTHTNLQMQGKNLANQIENYINQFKLQFSKISFIGHSLGGLVIRATLPYLSKYANKMHTIITLSTPHLGFYENSNLLKLGIKIFLDSKNSDSLKQLLFEDQQKTQECFLYKLANQQGMNWFKNILFFSSNQDKYIPVQSARVQRQQKIKMRSVYERMMDNLMKNLRANQVIRISIDFDIEQNTFDNLIGRTAHLKFLQDGKFIKNLCHILNTIWI